MSKELKRGAKQVYFEKEGENVVVKVKSVALNTVYAPEDANTGHGYIKIELVVLEGLSKSGLLVRSLTGNRHYICKPNKARNFWSNKVVVMCDYITSKTGAFQVMDNSEMQLKIVKLFNIYLSNTSARKFEVGRHVSRLTFTMGEVKGLVAQAGLFLQWAEGLIKTVEGYVCHHIFAEWDMSTDAIKALSSAEHNEEHERTSQASHAMIVHIKTEEEFIAFMNWLETDEYRNLFA